MSRWWTMTSRRKRKDNGMGGRFVGLPHWVMLHPSFRAASARARALLLDVAMQYDGRNNGRLVLAAKALRPLGWRSDDGIQKAKTELLALGLLVEVRKGAKPNRAAWFALGWRPLDVKDGIDLDPRAYVSLAARKDGARPPCDGVAEIDSRPPPHGVEAREIAPPHGVRAAPPTPPHGAIRGVFAPSLTPHGGRYLDITIPSAETERGVR